MSAAHQQAAGPEVQARARPQGYPGAVDIAPRHVYPLGGRVSPYTLLDVRSPIEVGRGALPGAVSLPLMTDSERHLVGIRYKEAGQQAAIELGYELVGDSLAERVTAWRGVIDAGRPQTAVACWRGGLRSRLVVQFADRDRAAKVAGGYKALRAHLMDTLPSALAHKRLVVLSGLTGAGKTRLLRRLADGAHGRGAAAPAAAGVGPAPGAPALQALDLEGLARHRGSAFGHGQAAQPSQQTFENALAAELVLDPSERLVVEDESRFVGVRALPDALFAAMCAAPVVVLEAGLVERSTAIYDEYVAEPTTRLGREAVAADLMSSSLKLKRRLGAAGVQDVIARIEALAGSDASWADPEAHTPWIGALLEGHYDPLYRRSLVKLARPVLFAGDEEAVTGWLRTEW